MDNICRHFHCADQAPHPHASSGSTDPDKNNDNLCDILPEHLSNLNFPNVKYYKHHGRIKDLEHQDIPNEEGYVAYYEDGTRVKIKFKSYKERHIKLFNNIKF